MLQVKQAYIRAMCRSSAHFPPIWEAQKVQLELFDYGQIQVETAPHSFRWSANRLLLSVTCLHSLSLLHNCSINCQPMKLVSNVISNCITKKSNSTILQFANYNVFQTVIFNTLMDLHSYVDPRQLTPEFGGSLVYTHVRLVQLLKVYFICIQKERWKICQKKPHML